MVLSWRITPEWPNNNLRLVNYYYKLARLMVVTWTNKKGNVQTFISLHAAHDHAGPGHAVRCPMSPNSSGCQEGLRGICRLQWFGKVSSTSARSKEWKKLRRPQVKVTKEEPQPKTVVWRLWRTLTWGKTGSQINVVANSVTNPLTHQSSH